MNMNLGKLNIDFSLDSLSPERIAAIVAALLLLVVLLSFVALKISKRIRPDHFSERWKSLQQKLPYRENWREAIVEADDLLHMALKKKKIKGRTMGEKLVNAQRLFIDNDAVWFGHKLRKKIDKDPSFRPKKQDVKKALLGLRAGLRDIGAM